MTHRTKATANARRAGLAARRALSAETRARLSEIIADRLLHRPEFTACRTLACYLPSGDEVDPTPIIERAWRAGKFVFAPVIGKNFQMRFCRLTSDTLLVRNRYGLWEPDSTAHVAPDRIDLVVTPVVAFDVHRHRIGMGSGYFDRCFSFLRHRKHWLRPKLFGLAFDCQGVEEIRPSPWDILLYRVLTERR